MGCSPHRESQRGFITVSPPSGLGGAQNYGSAFLPAQYRGTRIGIEKRPISSAQVANLKSSQTAAAQRAELAYRMQSAMPGVMDLEKETRISSCSGSRCR